MKSVKCLLCRVQREPETNSIVALYPKTRGTAYSVIIVALYLGIVRPVYEDSVGQSEVLGLRK